MNKRRLLKLADFLETVPRKSFAIEMWQARAADKPEGKKQGSCGFAGCAVGWAAHGKLFRGLTLKPGPDGQTIYPHYEGASAFQAVNKLFDLECGDFRGDMPGSYWLFTDSAYPKSDPTPKQVAKRIRQFVGRGGRPS